MMGIRLLVLEFSDRIIAFIADNALGGYSLVFVIAFAASLIGSNFVVPAGTVLVAVGTLVGGGIVSWIIAVWAALGAAGGTAVSFAIGRWIGPKITQSFLLRRRAQDVRRAYDLFNTHGTAAVFVGYFSGPLRAVVAVVAGVVGMSSIRFQVVNVLCSPLWAIVMIAQGAMMGAAVGADHPFFLAVPILAPVLASGAAVIALVLWGLSRRSASQRASRSAECRSDVQQCNKGGNG